MEKQIVYYIEMNGTKEIHFTIKNFLLTIEALFKEQDFEEIKDYEYTIGTLEMTKAEIESLPEFSGF